jgi:hypothetical protein
VGEWKGGEKREEKKMAVNPCERRIGNGRPTHSK